MNKPIYSELMTSDGLTITHFAHFAAKPDRGDYIYHNGEEYIVSKVTLITKHSDDHDMIVEVYGK